jgi:hypothetical protein
MGNRLFNVDIAGELNAAMGSLLPKYKLLKRSVADRTSGSLTSGRAVSFRSFSCRGILSAYAEDRIDGTNVKSGDRKVLILGDSLPKGVVPAPDDRIEAEGSTFTVIEVGRDPDAATYTCQVRD